MRLRAAATSARGACCRRISRLGKRCPGISRHGATVVRGCRPAIVQRWRRARPRDARLARRLALSIANRRRRRRAAARAASTPGGRSRAASGISSPAPAGFRSRREFVPRVFGIAPAHPSFRPRSGIGFRGCAIFSPMARTRVRNWRVSRERGALADRNRETRAGRARFRGVAAAPSGRADAGAAGPQLAAGLGYAGAAGTVRPGSVATAARPPSPARAGGGDGAAEILISKDRALSRRSRERRIGIALRP